MGKAQGMAPSVWCQEVARAVALQRHMPGVQQLQEQYVRYSGQSEAQQCDDGWLLPASRAQAAMRGAAQAQHSADSGAEAMSVAGPASTPTTPRTTLVRHQTVEASRHASHASPSPSVGGAGTPFGGGAEAMSVSAAPSDAHGGAGDTLPQQVQLSIKNAPAEFCMPIKRDKRFRPNFQIEVRVVHRGSVHLPLRVGVFAVTQEDRSRIQEWLPSEFVPVMELHDSDELVSSPGKRKKTTRKADKLPLEERLRRRGLKTHTVLSHVFQSPDNNQAASPASRSASARSPSDLLPGTSGERRPFFPSSAASPSGPPDPGSVELQGDHSLVARSDDPELATQVKLGGVQNTLLAQFEYQRLEFEIPSEVTPVYLVFACLVGNKDLLYTLYTPPSVSMCRRDQQAKSLAVLGLPKNAMQQVEALKGSSRAAHIASEDRRHTTPAAVPPAVPSGIKSPRVSPTAHSFGQRRADDSPHMMQTERAHKSDPIHTMHETREPFWAPFDRKALETATLPHTQARAEGAKQPPGGAHVDAFPEDMLQFDKPQGRSFSNPSLLDHASLCMQPMSAPEVRTQRDMMFTGQASERFSDSGTGLAASREPFWITSQEDDMKFLPLPSQASLDKVAPLDHWGPLPHDIAVDASPDPAAAALPSGSRPPDAHPFSFPQNRSHANNHPGNELEVQHQLSIQIPPHTFAAPATHPGLFRNESDAMSTDDGGFSGGFSGGFPGISGIPAAKPLFSPPVTGVAQAPVFSWTHQEYCASGMLREMTCVEARALREPPLEPRPHKRSPTQKRRPRRVIAPRVYASAALNAPTCALQPSFKTPKTTSLLSLAGFPDLAGVDKSARISSSQYADFRSFFSTTVASVQHVAALWNSRTPSVLGGFDVDQAAAAEALLPQPVGTFACFFSMQGQFAGHLVVACKVPPGEAGTDSSAWQEQIAYLAVSPGDLQQGNLVGILMGMSYATHVLDVYTGLRHDKRTRLASTAPAVVHGTATAEGST